ncbi:MAG: Gfo/Idh/MocA family oxidoreductase [Spirochaetales bacterium]|nr:Gfo/Idh/MocA family oxidoreductase [Spirochaetales bacterium]
MRFIIVGSGWRSLYYVRIAKALPERFELCAMLCRTEEKARRMALEHGIPTSTSVDECRAMAPDFVVVAVNKASIAEVSMQWMEYGFCVLSETPAALDMGTLRKLWELHMEGRRLVVCEQYRRYPEFKALIDLAESGLIGEPDALDCSLAHEYHGASLFRALLGIKQSEQFSVTARSYTFPVARTLTRYESFKDREIVPKKRTVARFEFENGKICLYDFDSEQYRSPIRKNTYRLTGRYGEIVDGTVRYLDSEGIAHVSPINMRTRKVQTGYDNPNLREIEEVTEVTFEDENLYSPRFGLCGLAQDETAIATMMEGTYLYAKGLADSPYPLEEALQDAYTMILLQKADETGEKVESEKQIWNCV